MLTVALLGGLVLSHLSSALGSLLACLSFFSFAYFEPELILLVSPWHIWP